MDWLILLFAGFLEVFWAFGLKYSAGFSKFWPSVATVIAMILSFVMLSLALKTIPLGTGYAVWTGIGAIGTVLIGMFFLGESRDLARIICLCLIVGGVVGLRFVEPK